MSGPHLHDAHPVPAAWTYGGDCPFPPATVPSLFLEQVRRTPGDEAVRQCGNALTYQGLAAAVESLASRLREAGVRPETRVGICADRTLALPVAILGVLLAGGAFVPLDRGHPRQRWLDILADAEAATVVVDPGSAPLLADSGRRLVTVPAAPDGAAEGVPPPASTRWTGGAHPDSAAYVMYTSGSTGRPKGVVVSHRNVVAFAAAAQARSPLPAGCRSAGFSSLAFDACIFDLLVPLIVGASVQLVPDEDRIDPTRLTRFLREHRVTRAMLPPAVLPLLDPGDLPDLTELYTAGEPCAPEQVGRWSVPGQRRFHNWYGPTETTVVVTAAELDGVWDRPLPIGSPLPGCHAWILDERARPCPPGVAGELFIGGPQLARGYLGKPGQTADRFVPDPFAPTPGARLYRTGDVVHWEADGTIAFLGRHDGQVKIQGQRAETGEVEAVLRAHPAVRQAVVDAVSGPAGLKHLIAYVAPADVPGLAGYCAERLPAFMVPAQIIGLAALPLTVSGKVDMAALRALAGAARTSRPPLPPPAAASDTAADRLVAQVWAEVFETAAPGPDDEFIASGGHSLLAMRLAAALRARSGRAVQVADVYLGRTVAGLAARLGQARPAGEDAVPAGSAPALTAGQRRLWFIEQLVPGCPVHNVAMAHVLTGRLDIGALRRALGVVARRHEALRWRISQHDGVPEVIADPAGEISLPVTVLTGLAPDARDHALRELLDEAATTPFALATGPLWRASLIRLSRHEHVLAITVHHIVFDGWSRDVLYDDLARAYRDALQGGTGADSTPGTRYADYVAWAARRTERQAGADLAWWLDHLAGAPLALDLPRDHSRPPVRTFRGARAEADVGRPVWDRLRDIARRAHATPVAVLLSVFAQLASRLTGQHDLVIGTPAADRGNAAFERVIGLCLDMLPLRLNVRDADSLLDHVRRCQDEIGAALAHRGASLEKIVEALGQPRDLSRNPVFQILFNPFDLTAPPMALPGCAAEPRPAGLSGSLFDLTLYVSERGGRLALQAVYNPDLYEPARINALLASYIELLAGLAADPGRPASSVPMRPAGRGLPGGHTPLPGWTGPGVVERVRAAAGSRPAAVAVSGPGDHVRYRDLMATCDRTVRAIRAAGLATGDTVAVLAARDVRLPAILLGLLASGARWLVLDPGLADPRLAQQVKAAGAKALVSFTDAGLPGGLDTGVPVLTAAALATGSRGRNGPGPADGEADVPAAERGYLSLTSGTTGEPKLVCAPELPLAHFLAWYAATFGLGSRDRFALLAGLSHDPLLRDVFTPLVLGGRLCVPGGDWVRHPERMTGWLRDQRVTVAHLTPQTARLLTAGTEAGPLPRLRLIVLGGDTATMGDLARLHALAPTARIVNAYGTTETPQVQAWHEVPASELAQADPGMPVPVGRGIDGAQLLVAGRHGGPAAIGELGEVIIRSRYLAAGYLDGELAGRRFQPARGRDRADRRFVTGDLGRYRPDGTVVLAGRADGQVKIRGFRVELGEIEAVLATHPDVDQAAVIADEIAGDHRLQAYVVPAAPGVTASRLQQHLRANLPGYAAAASVSVLPELPLTPNGKVDRAALRARAPQPPRGRTGELHTPTERLIAGVWREVTGVPRLAATDNFFEIGGHSLSIVAVSARLTQLLGRTVPVVDLFRYPAIGALAAHLDGSSGNGRDEALERARKLGARRRERARLRPARKPEGVVYGRD